MDASEENQEEINLEEIEALQDEEEDDDKKDSDKVDDSDKEESTDTEDGTGEEENTKDEAVQVEPIELLNFMRHSQQQNVDESQLPETVKVLRDNNGAVAYVVGTAHFSKNSCQDVEEVMSTVQPDAVMVELCHSRKSVLALNENYFKEINDTGNSIQRLQKCIKEKGFMSGIIVYMLHLSSNNVTNQLDMIPGEEMRTAHRESLKIPGCRVILGDRRVDITLKRMLARLSLKDKLLLGLRMFKELFTKISPEDVEEYKKQDVFEKVFQELVAEFPNVAKVLIEERDLYLTASIKRALAVPIRMPGELVRPPVLVSVVGMGHTPGIVKLFDSDMNPVEVLNELNTLPDVAESSKTLKYVVKGTLFTVTFYSIFRVLSWTSIFSNYPYLASL